ncbi:MAG: hypothetical protein HY720_16730 [Planctomycetes bacterium]|nr:hypothetical protein [Planctomycetota bacterium]
MSDPDRWLFCVLFAASLAAAAPAQDAEEDKVRVDGTIVVSPTGDAKAAYVVDVIDSTFALLKEKVANPYSFARRFVQRRPDYEIARGMVCRYEEKETTLVLERTHLGAAKYRGDGAWELPAEPFHEYVGPGAAGDDRHAFEFETSADANPAATPGRVTYVLPAGATGVEWDARRRVFRYELAALGCEGKGKFAFEFRTREQILASIYKVYGLGLGLGRFADQWVARTVLSNTGTHVLRDVRVRYQMGEYADRDWSTWEKTPEVLPGQTVVSLYYPVLDSKVALIRTNAPAKVRVQIEYETTDGAKKSEEDEAMVVILGVNEFKFTSLEAEESQDSGQFQADNSRFLAAWVSRNDPVVKQLAALANKMAQGAAARDNDDDAMKILHACYSLLLLAEITYQHPPALADRSVSFDPELVQNIKFPRDVIRDKSGTCIDLAILCAAMGHAVGLKPFLVVLPTHCFPAFEFPSGKLIAVEATGVQGGLRFGSGIAFPEALAQGDATLKESLAAGTATTIDVQALWSDGIPNPELENLPADILRSWGYDERQILDAWDDYRKKNCTGNCVNGEGNSCSCSAWGICGKESCVRPSAAAECTGDCQPAGANQCSCKAWGACGKETCVQEPGGTPSGGAGCTGTCAPGAANACSCQTWGTCGQDTCRQGEGSAPGPGPEPACTGTCAPGAANGCSCKNWGECGKETCANGPGGGSASGGGDFAGTWQGKLHQVLPNGLTLDYEMTIAIESLGNGRYRGTYSARTTVPTQAMGLVDCKLDQIFLGETNADGVLVLEGRQKILTALIDSSTAEWPADTLQARLVGDRLAGKIGNDTHGYSEFSFARKNP